MYIVPCTIVIELQAKISVFFLVHRLLVHFPSSTVAGAFCLIPLVWQDPVTQALSAIASVSVLSRWNLKRYCRVILPSVLLVVACAH